MTQQHVAIYLRASSSGQDLRSQRADLERWVKAYADGEPAVWYVDKASGSTMDRPAWPQLEAGLRAGASRASWSGASIVSAAPPPGSPRYSPSSSSAASAW